MRIYMELRGNCAGVGWFPLPFPTAWLVLGFKYPITGEMRSEKVCEDMLVLLHTMKAMGMIRTDVELPKNARQLRTWESRLPQLPPLRLV